jgi:hypothetical protein
MDLLGELLQPSWRRHSAGKSERVVKGEIMLGRMEEIVNMESGILLELQQARFKNGLHSILDQPLIQ